MSHFIQNTKNLQNHPIFSLATKQIVMPKIKKYIKTKPDDQNINHRKQSKLLNSICQRLQKQQFQEIHNQNVREMQKKFDKLKKRMHNNVDKQSVENIFSSQVETQKLNIREIVKMRPERIQLEKKYGNQIILKMQNYRQAQQIKTMKEKYINWYDSEKNDRCSSPIFKKMAYLLQRANKQNALDELPFVKNQKLIRHTVKQVKQLSQYSLQKSLNKNSSPYRKRQLNWGSKKQKFSIFNHNFEC